MSKRIGLISLYNKYQPGLRYLKELLQSRGIEAPILFFKHDYGYSLGEKFNYPTEIEKQLFIEFCSECDAVGFSVFSGFFPIVKELITLLKERLPRKPIIIGGIHATLAPQQCADVADYVVLGDGEVSLKKIEMVVKGKRPEQTPNFWTGKDGTVLGLKIYPDLDELPFPDWTDRGNWFIEDNKLFQENHTKHVVEYMCATARGCPFSCSYCANSAFVKLYKGKSNLRQRSVDNVMAELIRAKKIHPNLGVIDFCDDVFTMDSDWVKGFAEKYKQYINLPFFCLVQPNMTKTEDIAVLKNAGLRAVTIGIQSGSKKILYDVYKRYTSPDKIISAINTINNLGVHVVADLIVDNPYDTEETMQETFDLLMHLNKPFHLNMPSLTHLPYTELTERALKEGVIKETMVEGNSTKSVENWFDYQDSKSSKMHTFWNSLFRMAGYKGISNTWLIKLSRDKHYREHPVELRTLSFRLTKFWNSRIFKMHRFSSIHIQHLKVRLGL